MDRVCVCAGNDCMDNGDWRLHGSWIGKDVIKKPADVGWQIPLWLRTPRRGMNSILGI